jgi:hypothetical protein
LNPPIQLPRRKHASVTVRDELILVETISYSGYLGVSNGPFFWLAESTPNPELGRVVREAMNCSVGLPLDFPIGRKEFEARVFAGTPFSGWSNFQRRALRISVTEEQGQIAFTPTENQTSKRKGALYLPEKAIRIDTTDDLERIGSLVRNALQLCE